MSTFLSRVELARLAGRKTIKAYVFDEPYTITGSRCICATPTNHLRMTSNMLVLDSTYLQVLHFGLMLLRNVSLPEDDEWAKSLAVMLHNIPSLIGDASSQGHLYFWDEERKSFFEWLESSARPDHQKLAAMFLAPQFDALKPHIDKLRKLSAPGSKPDGVG